MTNSSRAPFGARTKLILVLLFCFILIGGLVLASVFPNASNQGYYPEQPIPFSHKLHAGNMKIPCLYCHSAAERSRHATVPALSICMNCHRAIQKESAALDKLKDAFSNGVPIEWLRIHRLPDHVYFPHKDHIAKGVSCQTCHGEVQTMERVYQAKPLTMGWCIDCHLGTTTPPKVMERVKQDIAEGKGVHWYMPNGPVGPRDCSACHR